MSLTLQSCNCIGPQNGQPLCPCQMRGVVERDGRYVKVSDLGPVTPVFKKLKCQGCAASIAAIWKHCPHCGIALNPQL